jgi:hypothetical protein
VRVFVAAMMLALVPVTARAQTASPPLHRLELAGGIGFLGRATLGDANADLRSGSSTDPYRLFTTSTEQMGVTALDLRAGFDFTRRYGVEAHLLFGHPELHTEISSDAEGAPAITAVERLDQYVIDGGLVVRLGAFRVKGIQPFVTAGSGYLRQLHEGLTVIESGRLFYVGGGVRYMMFARPRGVPRAGGLRGDARLNMLTGGIEIEDRTRRQPSVSGSFFLLF